MDFFIVIVLLLFPFSLFSFFLTLGILFKVQKLTLKKEASAQGHNSPHPCLKGIFVNIPVVQRMLHV